MAFFGFRVNDDAAAARFTAFAASRGGCSAVLRRLMNEAMAAAGLEPSLDGEGASKAGSEKLTLRLKELAAPLDEACSAAGMRRTEWAMSALRARLMRKPQFNKDQTVALVEARQELARISANLRELVRLVRAGDIPAEAVAGELARVEGFRQEVRGQLVGVRAAIDGASDYWDAAA